MPRVRLQLLRAASLTSAVARRGCGSASSAGACRGLARHSMRGWRWRPLWRSPWWNLLAWPWRRLWLLELRRMSWARSLLTGAAWGRQRRLYWSPGLVFAGLARQSCRWSLGHFPIGIVAWPPRCSNPICRWAFLGNSRRGPGRTEFRRCARAWGPFGLARAWRCGASCWSFSSWLRMRPVRRFLTPALRLIVAVEARSLLRHSRSARTWRACLRKAREPVMQRSKTFSFVPAGLPCRPRRRNVAARVLRAFIMKHFRSRSRRDIGRGAYRATGAQKSWMRGMVQGLVESGQRLR